MRTIADGATASLDQKPGDSEVFGRMIDLERFFKHLFVDPESRGWRAVDGKRFSEDQKKR